MPAPNEPPGESKLKQVAEAVADGVIHQAIQGLVDGAAKVVTGAADAISGAGQVAADCGSAAVNVAVDVAVNVACQVAGSVLDGL